MTGIKKTHKKKKEKKRNLKYLYDRLMTKKLVFNILFLDRINKIKQNKELCNGLVLDRLDRLLRFYS